MALFHPPDLQEKSKNLSHSQFLLFVRFHVTLFLDKKAGFSMDLKIDPNWTYRQVIYHIRALKSQYEGALTLFSSFEPRLRTNFIYSVRNKFYDLNLIEWQIDNLWRYMNNDMEFNDLILSALHYK